MGNPVIKGRLSISRDSSDTIEIEFRDSLSRIRFATARVDPRTFAMAVTGQSELECLLETRGLENVGKKLVAESRSIEVYLGEHRIMSREVASEIVQMEDPGEGWTVDPYMGAQGSIQYLDGSRARLNYRVYKYVEVDDGQ